MKIIKNLKIIYFPSPKAWKNSTILFIFTHTTGLIAPIFYIWFLIVSFCYCALTLNPIALLFLMIIILGCLLLFVYYGIAMMPYFIVLKICNFIFGDNVKLLDPAIESWEIESEEAIIYLLIAAFSSLPFYLIQFTIAIWGISWNELLDNIYDDLSIEYFFSTALTPSNFLQLSWIWLITAAYLYESVYYYKNKKS